MMLTNQQLDTLKKELLDLKSDTKETLNGDSGILDDQNMHESTGELSTYDNHPADMGTELFDREMDMALSVHEEDQLEKINEALSNMETGTYGKCKVCNEDIAFERLQAIPYAATCKAHAEGQDIPDDRPVEEDYLSSASDESFRREDKRDGIRDYEDSFDEVARYGTSETPSDFTEDHDSYDELYRDDIREGFTEEYEQFTGNDITGQEKEVFQTENARHYEQQLDEEDLDTPFGDLPYDKTDGYVEDDDSTKE